MQRAVGGATGTVAQRWSASPTNSNLAIFWWDSLRSAHPTGYSFTR